MSRRLERWRGRLEQELPEVVVCRGGDCGSRRKHPGFDHVGQLARIREAVQDRGTVTVSRCLDACERSNVVVVIPGRRAREAGARPCWVGEVLDDATTAAVIASSDAIEPAPGVRAHRFEPGPGSLRDLSRRRSGARRAAR